MSGLWSEGDGVRAAMTEQRTLPTRPPFSESSEPDEWEYTTAARIMCDCCGEWIYTRRKRGTSNPHALPPECQVCGAPIPSESVDE